MAITIDSAPDSIHMTKGQMVFALSTDNTDATHILVNVLIELVFGSGTFNQVFSLDLPVDDDGAVTFHLEERIRAYLSFKLPDPNGAFVQAIDGPLKRYKIEYAELTADDMEFVQAVYHNDRSGSYPYVEEVALDEAMEVGVKYITISETDNPDLLDDMEYTDGTNTVSPGTVEAFPRKQKQVMDVVTAYAYDAILLPANVTVRIYANALAYTVSDVYHSLLGAFSNKQLPIVLVDYDEYVLIDNDGAVLIDVPRIT